MQTALDALVHIGSDPASGLRKRALATLGELDNLASGQEGVIHTLSVALDSYDNTVRSTAIASFLKLEIKDEKLIRRVVRRQVIDMLLSGEIGNTVKFMHEFLRGRSDTSI